MTFLVSLASTRLNLVLPSFSPNWRVPFFDQTSDGRLDFTVWFHCCCCCCWWCCCGRLASGSRVDRFDFPFLITSSLLLCGGGGQSPSSNHRRPITTPELIRRDRNGVSFPAGRFSSKQLIFFSFLFDFFVSHAKWVNGVPLPSHWFGFLNERVPRTRQAGPTRTARLLIGRRRPAGQ